MKRHVPAGWTFAKIIHTDGVRTCFGSALDDLTAVHVRWLYNMVLLGC